MTYGGTKHVAEVRHDKIYLVPMETSAHNSLLLNTTRSNSYPQSSRRCCGHSAGIRSTELLQAFFAERRRAPASPASPPSISSALAGSGTDVGSVTTGNSPLTVSEN